MDEREKRFMQGLLAEAGIDGIVIDGGDMGVRRKKSPQEIKDDLTSALDGYTALVEDSQYWLDQHLTDWPTKIDEIAIIYSDHEMANGAALSMASLDGVDVFNTASDHVHTIPFDTHYDVDYRFVQHVEKPWRIEIMSIEGGHSPLHESLWHRRNTPQVEAATVHLSWKMEDEEAYHEIMKYLAGEVSWVMGQSCQSEYGMFSYWKFFGEGAPNTGMWFKPRVNRRDA